MPSFQRPIQVVVHAEPFMLDIKKPLTCRLYDSSVPMLSDWSEYLTYTLRLCTRPARQSSRFSRPAASGEYGGVSLRLLSYLRRVTTRLHPPGLDT